MKQSARWQTVLLNGLTMAIVTGVSLLLLVYVGQGEAKRTFTHFQTEKLAAQGRLLQTTMEHFLRPGLPLQQFVGFRTSAEPILASDATIASISIFDRAGSPVFEVGEVDQKLLPVKTEGSSRVEGRQALDIRQDDDTLQVVLPLRNRFERVGSLVLSMPFSVVEERVKRSFQPVLIASAIAAIGFGVFVAMSAQHLAGRRQRWMQVTYGLIFVAISGVVIATLVSLYSEGAQAKTKGLADSLGQRLSSVLHLNVNIMEVQGLERVFQDYKRLNPDIRSAGLVIDDYVMIHTDDEAFGKPWASNPSDYEYIVDLGKMAGRNVRVAVAVPSDIVLKQTARSVKNFAALFIASAFMAGIFLQFAGSVQNAGRSMFESDSAPTGSVEDRALLFVKPVFFIAVFSEHLTYAFLPQFIQSVAQTSGFSEDAASFVFTSYFVAFAASLLPAGFYAQQRSARPLMYFGLILSATGLLILSSLPSFWMVLTARVFSGFGQGILFIGIQSYILATSSPARKTRGASIIVFGFQGGMISGMAIGSLLVTQLGERGVFTFASGVAFAMMLYTVCLIPKVKSGSAFGTNVKSFRNVVADIGVVLRNFEFLRTILLIGIPAKSALTGVIIFALPLLMGAADYRQEDIGQILMIYAVAVVTASAYISRTVDQTGRTGNVLVIGALLAGVGMGLIGLTGTDMFALSDDTLTPTILLVLGAAIVGTAHGFINAPVVTHVVNSELSRQVGEAPASAAYRFLERIGHVAGPLMVGQLFAFYGQSPTVVAQIGAVVAVLGLLFIIRPAPVDRTIKEKGK